MTAPVIVSPADPAKIAAVLQAKRAREAAKALRAVRRRLMRRVSLAEQFRAVICRRAGPDGVSIADVERVISDVAERRGISRASIIGHSRIAELAAARAEIWWTLHRRHGLSLSMIARAFRRDHTTIRHGVRRWQASFDQEGGT